MIQHYGENVKRYSTIEKSTSDISGLWPTVVPLNTILIEVLSPSGALVRRGILESNTTQRPGLGQKE